MKILVCISHVPDTTSKINFVDNSTKFDTNGVQFIIGPYDDYALARAIELKEAAPGTTVTLNLECVKELLPLFLVALPAHLHCRH